MFGLKRFFSRDGGPETLPSTVRTMLESWRQQALPSRDNLHFHTRYVVLDVGIGGHDPETSPLLGISAVTVHHGVVSSEDACFVDLTVTEPDVLAEQLAAFLCFIGHDPLVTFHEPFVATALQRAIKAGLGEDFDAAWIDLAWLLPAMFEEHCDSAAPLDLWVGAFALETSGERRDTMANALVLAKLFQQLLVRAVERQIDNAARLMDESKACQHLRRTH